MSADSGQMRDASLQRMALMEVGSLLVELRNRLTEQQNRCEPGSPAALEFEDLSVTAEVALKWTDALINAED